MPDAPSLRDTIESAMSASESVTDAPEAGEASSTPAPEPVAAPPEKVEAAPKAEGQPRRPDGKFDAKPKDAEKSVAGASKAPPIPPGEPPAAEQGKPAGTEAPSPANPVPAGQPAVKAPQSWKPQVRELAAKLPPEFRPILEESNRRELETNRVMQESAQARQVAQQTHQALQPYEGIARAAGMDAWSWAGQALQERAQLQMGSTAQRAPILARMLAEGGQDLIQQVASILDGQATPQAAPQQPMPDPRAIFREEMAAVQQQYRAQASKAEAEAFLATSPEFVNDVLPQMNAIYAAAKADGRNVTMKEAYDQACWMNPDVRDIIQSRKTVDAAKAQASTVQRSRAAAVSVRGSPTQAPRSDSKQSLHETVATAFANANRV